jgi:hypothetical protein
MSLCLKCEHKSTDYFFGYKLYVESVDLWELLENLKGLADFTSRENEYASTFTFDRGRFMDMVKDLDLTKVRKQVAYIENLAKNQPKFFTYQDPLKQDVVLTIEDMDTGLKYRFMLVDFLAGASGSELGYLEPQGSTSTITPTNGTATKEPPPPLAPPSATTAMAAGNVSQQPGATDTDKKVDPKKDPTDDPKVAGLACIRNHFYASLAHSVRFFTDKLRAEPMEKLAQHGRVLAGRVETARSIKPLLPKPQVYEWDYRKAADLSLRISTVSVDSYPEDLKKIQKDLSRDYIFHAEPKQRVIYAVSAAAAYSFVTDYDAKRTDAGKVSVTEKDASGINGAIMLNIYNPDWYDDLFEPFFQVGVLPDSDDYGLFLGTGFSADKGRYSVGMGVAYQRVDRLRPGISAGQSVAAGVPLTDKEFEAGLYIQVGLSLGKP